MPTLLELRTQVRQRANMENSTFVTDSELNGYIVNSHYELYDILISRFENWNVKPPLPLTVAGGASSFTLPTDFYKMIGLDRAVTDPGDWMTVRPFVFTERNKYNRPINRIYGEVRVAYNILGNIVYLLPQDTAPGQYQLWYIPKPTPLVADGDSVDGVSGWDEYIIVDAAIKCLIKEESDVSVLLMEKNALLKRIQEMSANRDAGEPTRIGDVGQDSDWQRWWW